MPTPGLRRRRPPSARGYCGREGENDDVLLPLVVLVAGLGERGELLTGV